MNNIFKNYDWENWLSGLFAAVIGGGANAVVGAVGLNLSDPSHFNAKNNEFFKVVAVLFATSATVSCFMYLKQSPIPRLVSKTTTTLTVEKTLGNAKEPEATPEQGAK
jgi:hypothetical protein